MTAYYVSNRVSVHRIHADGSLSEEPVCVVATDRNAHGVAIDQTNRFVYVSHTGANRLINLRLMREAVSFRIWNLRLSWLAVVRIRDTSLFIPRGDGSTAATKPDRVSSMVLRCIELTQT